MVYSSVPVYLDPPNWHQQHNPEQGGGNDNLQLPTILPPPQLGGGGGSSSATGFRLNSMSNQAQIAKISQPEPPLKCPRCESTNTKFCYFNNYSLSQPRHFCKTCRRYWTRGGSLRNVPVGGGCRRNKRSKRSRSKSPMKASLLSSPSYGTGGQILGHLSPVSSQLPLLHNLGAYGSEFQTRTSLSGNRISLAGAGFGEQCPFLELPKANNGLSMIGSEGFIVSPGYTDGADRVRSCSDPPVPMKVEENQGLNLPKNFLGISTNDQIWGGNAWTDLSGFTSSI